MCQPPNANSPATIAERKASRMRMRCRPGPGARATGTRGPSANATAMIRDDGRDFENRERRLHDASLLHADVVDRREHHDGGDGEPAAPTSPAGKKNVT